MGNLKNPTPRDNRESIIKNGKKYSSLKSVIEDDLDSQAENDLKEMGETDNEFSDKNSQYNSLIKIL